MRYIAIEFIGQNEVTGCRFVLDDWKLKDTIAEFNFNDENDSSRLGRVIYSYLIDLGFKPNKDGRIVLDPVFGIFDLRLLQHLGSVNNYIEMRLYNPLILFCENETIPPLKKLTSKNGVYGIVDIVRRRFK